MAIKNFYKRLKRLFDGRVGKLAELKKIPVNQLRENSYNPNKLTGFKYDALVKQIAQEKEVVQPLLVRFNPLKNSEGITELALNAYEILDGEHRWKAAKQVGLTEIPCMVIEANDNRARAWTLGMNNIRGKPDALLLADVLRQLSESYSTDQLKELCAFNEREIAYYLKLLEAPVDFTSAIELKNELPITLTFIVSEKEASVVNDALERINPENKSKALVKLCLENLNGEN